MTIIFFLMLLGLGCYFAFKLIAPELNISFDHPLLKLPWRRRHLREDIVRLPHKVNVIVKDIQKEEQRSDADVLNVHHDKIRLLEKLLLEKNADINRLNQTLENERKHRILFEKTQELFQEEIVRLKQEVKNIRKLSHPVSS